MKVQFLLFLFYLLAYGQAFAESEKWLIVPFEKINHDAKCEKLSKQFLQTLTQSLSSELSVIIIADLQALPCAKEDCAKIRAQNLSSYFVLYGKSICEKTSLEIHTNLGFLKKNTTDNQPPQWIQSEYVIKQNQEQDFQIKAYEVVRKIVDQMPASKSLEENQEENQSKSKSLNEFSAVFSYVSTNQLVNTPTLFGFSLGYARQFTHLQTMMMTIGMSIQKIAGFKSENEKDFYEQTSFGIDVKLYSSKKSAIRYFLGLGLMKNLINIEKITQADEGDRPSNVLSTDWRYSKQEIKKTTINNWSTPVQIGVRWFSTILQPTFSLTYQQIGESKNYMLNLGGVW